MPLRDEIQNNYVVSYVSQHIKRGSVGIAYISHSLHAGEHEACLLFRKLSASLYVTRRLNLNQSIIDLLITRILKPRLVTKIIIKLLRIINVEDIVNFANFKRSQTLTRPSEKRSRLLS